MGLRNHSQCVCSSCDLASVLIYLVATYSNLENHPRLIRARQHKSVPRIQLDSKTGLPIVDGEKVLLPSHRRVEVIQESEEDPGG